MKMNILVIEDCKPKFESISRCIRDRFPEAAVTCAVSYQEGVNKAYKGNFDFIVLDNSLPVYSSYPNDVKTDMASVILDEFNEFGINSPCVICSQYDPGEKEAFFTRLVNTFDSCVGFIRYDNTSDEWKGSLIIYLEEIIKVKKDIK